MTDIKRHRRDFAINGGSKCFNVVKTTMNLPAPEFKDFEKKLLSYDDNKSDPIVDLEAALCKFHNVSYVIAFSSCFTAMALTLKALALPARNEVIIPALTYRRMSDIILWAGLIPCFCDNAPDTLGVDAFNIKKMINNNTAVILAPHPIVKLSDIEQIIELGNDKGIPVMFDSVEATGGEHKGISIGSFGMAESFSLHPSKLINACEGGYITTNNEKLYSTLMVMRGGGKTDYNGEIKHGHSSCMNRYHSIMGLSSLDIVNDTINDNYEHYRVYQENLRIIPGVRLVEYEENEKRNYKSILVEITEEFCITRDELHDILNFENIYARKYYYPAQHTTQKNKSPNCIEHYDVAEYIQGRYLLLPFGYSTSKDDIRIICQLISDINDIYAKYKT